jgi:hypothetical protein
MEELNFKSFTSIDHAIKHYEELYDWAIKKSTYTEHPAQYDQSVAARYGRKLNHFKRIRATAKKEHE